MIDDDDDEYDQLKAADEKMLIKFAELHSTIEHFGLENFSKDDPTLAQYNRLKDLILQSLEWAWDH